MHHGSSWSAGICRWAWMSRLLCINLLVVPCPGTGAISQSSTFGWIWFTVVAIVNQAASDWALIAKGHCRNTANDVQDCTIFCIQKPACKLQLVSGSWPS